MQRFLDCSDFYANWLDRLCYTISKQTASMLKAENRQAADNLSTARRASCFYLLCFRAHPGVLHVLPVELPAAATRREGVLRLLRPYPITHPLFPDTPKRVNFCKKD
jgi:hypothetical protein